jgi:hypothetical protein
VRLRQIHRAGPEAFNHLRQILLLDLVGSMSQQGCNGALRKARVHRESHIGGAKELVDEFGQCRRQALPPEFRRDGYPGPAAFNDLRVSFLETFGSRYAAIGPALAAFFVANAIEWCQHFLAEFCCFAQHRFHDVGRSV